MSGLQKTLVAGAILLFLVLYFGFDTRAPEYDKIERDRELSGESTGVNVLLRDAKALLDANQLSRIGELEQQIESAEPDSLRIRLLKQLSGAWYELERADLAGVYAEEVALLSERDEAWAIAGTTYAVGARTAKEEKIREFCQGRVIKAFENAISLSPDNLRHKVNLALTYVDSPPENNPMKGVLMLVELNKKYPDSPMILFHLGRLAIQTGQYEKAIDRLKRAVELEPDNASANCLLAKALQESGDQQQAAVYNKKCAALSK